MTGLIAVDPGVAFCAVAWFSPTGALLAAEHRTEPLPVQVITDKWRTVCEVPQVYDPRKAKRHVDPQDIIDLTLCAGRMTGGRECEYFTPGTWKGQLKCSCGAKIGPDQCLHHRRMLKALSADEWAVLQAHVVMIPTAIRHNVYDAVSLGLVVLQRLTPVVGRGRKIGQR